MHIRLADLAQALAVGLQGDPDFVVRGVKAPEDARDYDIVVLLEAKWLPAVLASAARTVLLPDGEIPAALADRNLLISVQPRADFAALLARFYPEPAVLNRVSDRASIVPTARLGKPVEIGPFVTVEANVVIGDNTRIGAHCTLGRDSRIGSDCRIGPNVTIAPGTIIGDRVVIHAGTVIGADGYGFYQDEGRHHKIPQVGIVVIEDDVEIGANVTIDRATLGQTLIGAGTKIDNLVQIGHNVRIGKHCLLISQVGISGSTVLGDHVILAGQTGVAGHLEIGSGVVAAGKSGITRNIPPGLKVSGYPAQEHGKELRQQAALRLMPNFMRQSRKSPNQAGD